MHDAVSSHDVLIFSADPLAAALLGAAVDLAGHVPGFPKPDETARAALLRVRPGVALVDCDHEEACSDGFVGPALMTGAKVLLVQSRRTKRDATELAKRLGLVVAQMPMDHQALARLLDDLLRSAI
jgi:hypothetical protein